MNDKIINFKNVEKMRPKEFDKENSMLVDIQYVRPNRKNGTPDYLYFIWKDLLTGEKRLTSVASPTIDIYFEKPECRTHDNNRTYAKLENLDKVTCKYTQVIPTIAKNAGPEAQKALENIFTSKDYGSLKDFMAYRYTFGSDIDIRDFYRIKWLKQFDNNKYKPLSKGFLDIETDSIRINGFTDAESCPVDLVTVIDKDSRSCHTFCLVRQQYDPLNNHKLLTDEQIKKDQKLTMLYDQRHAQEEELMANQREFERELREEFKEHYGNFDYKLHFFNDERTLLVHLFQYIHSLKLDFIVVWNISFDIPYIIRRLEKLGLDPAEVMCHPDFPVKECYFKKDKKNSLPKNKSDYFHCSDYTVWYDQMILYAAIRKSESELRSNRLTDVAHDELKDEKLDYSEDGNIKTLPYVNYRKYIKYNIKDVMLQYGIEDKTKDLETLYSFSYRNATQYDQVFKQTLKLRNVQYLSFLDQGLIPGNNINQLNMYKQNNLVEADYEEEDEENEKDSKFEGALVGNPSLNDYYGMNLYGSPSNSIFNYSIDMDMSSFYPNTIYTMNIDPNCLYFKTIVDAKQFEPRGGKLKFHGITDKQMVPDNTDSFSGDIGKEIFDNFQTRNWLSCARKWNNMPSVADVYEACLERFGRKRNAA